MKKYELLKDSFETFTCCTGPVGTPETTYTVYRIRALRDFRSLCGDIKAGDIGGYIESEDNLSHEGNCWIEEGKVAGDSRIIGNASIAYCNEIINSVIGGTTYIRIEKGGIYNSKIWRCLASTIDYDYLDIFDCILCNCNPNLRIYKIWHENILYKKYYISNHEYTKEECEKVFKLCADKNDIKSLNDILFELEISKIKQLKHYINQLIKENNKLTNKTL